MTAIEIEKRIAAIEQELATLKAAHAAASSGKQHPARILEATHGTFHDDEALREAMRLGRKWRNSIDARRRRKSKAKRK